MYDKDEIKVALGGNRTPSAATIAVAESLKNEGNTLLNGEMAVQVVTVLVIGRQQEERWDVFIVY